MAQKKASTRKKASTTKKASTRKKASTTNHEYKPSSESVDEIIKRLVSDVQDSPATIEASWSTVDSPGTVVDDASDVLFRESSNNVERTRLSHPLKRMSIKAVMIAGILLLVIAGFWGRSAVSLLGIPVDSAPYSALYFEDPHLATTGVKVGSLVAFGINNGSSKSRNFKWQAKVESLLLNKGTIKLRPHQRIALKVRVTSGKPMDFIRISVNTLDSPIVVVVTA